MVKVGHMRQAADGGADSGCLLLIGANAERVAALYEQLRPWQGALRILSAVASPQSLPALLDEQGPDLLLWEADAEIDMSSLLHTWARQHPRMGIVVSCMQASDAWALQVFRAGAQAVSHADQLGDAIDTALARWRAQKAPGAMHGGLLEAAFEHAPVGLWLFGTNGAPGRSNAHARELLRGQGDSPGSGAASKPSWHIDGGPPQPPQETAAAQALLSGHAVPMRLARVRNAAGQKRVIRFGAVPLGEPADTVLGALVVASDESETYRKRQAQDEALAQARELAIDVLARKEAEMARLSGELHDDIGQTLSLLKLRAGAAAQRSHGVERRLTEAEEAAPLVDLVLKRLREICNEINPSELGHFGLLAALRALADQTLRACHLDVQVQTSGPVEPIDGLHALALYRVAQQAVTNTLHHAEARHVRISLDGAGDSVCLSVTDDGRGFDATQPGDGVGHGLRSMRDRMRVLDGRFELNTAVGNGCSIVACVPRLRAETPPPEDAL